MGGAFHCRNPTSLVRCFDIRPRQTITSKIAAGAGAGVGIGARLSVRRERVTCSKRLSATIDKLSLVLLCCTTSTCPNFSEDGDWRVVVHTECVSRVSR